MLGKTNLTTLDGGCVVVTSEMPGVESFAIGFDAGVGSRHEPASAAGWSHFLEHLLFKGSGKRRSTRAISEPIESRGGALNAYTAQDHTFFYAAAPYDAASVVLDTIGDMFTDPLLPPREVERERGVVLEEIKMYHDDDAAFASDLAGAALWPNHPLGRPILGTPETLAAATPDALGRYRADRYRAASTVVAAAGHLRHDRIVDMVAPFAARLRGGAAVRPRPAAMSGAARPLVFEQRETQQVQAVISFRAMPDSDPRRAALSVLCHILGRGMTSRLFMSVREKLGLAYSIYSETQLFRDTGAFQIMAGVNPDKSLKALETCGRELRRIASVSPGKSEFSRAVNCLVGQLRMTGETSGSQLSWVLDKVRRHGRVESPGEVADRLRAVTPDDVKSVAAAMFSPENVSLSLVMPRDSRFRPEEHLGVLQSAL